jgi:hypothetical protein
VESIKRLAARDYHRTYFGGKLASIPSTAFFNSPEDASVLMIPRARPCQTNSLSSARCDV